MPRIDDKITVAMITLNEEGAIARVIGDIRTFVPNAEILIIDSSDDDTAAIAQRLGARVIRQFPPRGYGPAMDLALRSGNRAVTVTLDCDDTYPADHIECLARLVIDDGFDVVDGCRLMRKPAAMRRINYIGNRVFAMIASLLFGVTIYDLHSGMRAYRGGVPEALGYDPVGAALPVEILLLALRRGLKVKSVAIPYRERVGDSVMNPLETSWWTIKRILSARFRRER